MSVKCINGIQNTRGEEYNIKMESETNFCWSDRFCLFEFRERERERRLSYSAIDFFPPLSLPLLTGDSEIKGKKDGKPP